MIRLNDPILEYPYSAACLIVLVRNSSALDGFKFPDG
jgi:hypothetical protein